MKYKIDQILNKLTTTKHKCQKCESLGEWQSENEIKEGFVMCFNCGFTFPVKNAIKWQ